MHACRLWFPWLQYNYCAHAFVYYCFEYQGGSHVEVFTAQGRDPLSRWKLTGSVNRVYHKDVRGYVVTMEGGSSTISTQMKLPKTEKLLCKYVKCKIYMAYIRFVKPGDGTC